MDSSETIDRDNGVIQRYLEGGDARELGKLYEAHKEQIFFHCLKIVGHEEDARDLASETFIRAFSSIDKFKEGSPFSPWLHRIAVNLCIDHLRKKSRYKLQPLEENTLPAGQAADDDRQGRKKAQEIIAAIRKLKPTQRRCFCLFYVHGLSYKEISELTGYASGQVRSYIQNGRRNFKIFMEKTIESP